MHAELVVNQLMLHIRDRETVAQVLSNRLEKYGLIIPEHLYNYGIISRDSPLFLNSIVEKLTSFIENERAQRAATSEA